MKKVLVYVDEKSELPLQKALEDMYAPCDTVEFVFFHVSLFGNDGEDALRPYRNWAKEVGADAEFISRGLKAMSDMAINDEIGMLLVEYGKDHDIDQITMTKEGLGQVRKLLYGDTERYVSDNAMWPVIVVPTGVVAVDDDAVGQYAGRTRPTGD